MESVTSPPRIFAIVSLVMIAVMLSATGLTQAPFFRQTVIDREAAIVNDMANALLAQHDVSSFDLDNYKDIAIQQRLDHAFHSLRSLSGIVQVKVFNRDNTIAWSDNPHLIGTQRTAHLDYLKSAVHGAVRAVFNPAMYEASIFDRGQSAPESIEFYVPLLDASKSHSSEVIGVLALYRSPNQLNETIRHGLYLLWAVIGSAGLLLFAALYRLFLLVYSRQKTAELKFGKLTKEHQHIVQIEKMSAMGELVGEIAHQLNSPLVGVLNLAQLAAREADDPRRVRELLEDVQKAGNECREVVQRILRINQASHSEPQATDMQDLALDTIKFCHQSIGRDHRVDFLSEDRNVLLNVDPVLIRHALFNLIHNAILAAPKDVVTVSLAPEQQDDVPGYRLSVKDRGKGFDDEVAAKLFKPFFTTRSKGTGLGLAVVQHIAVKHGGSIRAENLPEGGARFSIWLPAITTL